MTPTEQQKAAALEDLKPFLDAKKPPFSDGAKVIWAHSETIRALLQPTTPVDAEVREAIECLRIYFKSAMDSVHPMQRYVETLIRAAQSPKSCDIQLSNFKKHEADYLAEIAVLKSQCEGLVKALEEMVGWWEKDYGSIDAAIVNAHAAIAEHFKNMGEEQ